MKNLKLYYRLRNIDNLLGEYKELEKQSIYLAPHEKLNDPMEGCRNFIWNGDEILWRNFFRHYIYHIEYFEVKKNILGSQYNFSKEEINIFQDWLDVSSTYRDLLERIFRLFFSYRWSKKLIEKISNRDLNRSQVLYYLYYTYPLCVKAIYQCHIEAGIYRGSNLVNDEIFSRLEPVLNHEPNSHGSMEYYLTQNRLVKKFSEKNLEYYRGNFSEKFLNSLEAVLNTQPAV